MTIEIKRPEIEALIQQRLHSGGFESVEDVLFDALEIQGEREAWVQENKEAINARIERVWLNSTRAKAYGGRATQSVLNLTRRRGWRIHQTSGCRGEFVTGPRKSPRG